jgi:hypothetical protein
MPAWALVCARSVHSPTHQDQIQPLASLAQALPLLQWQWQCSRPVLTKPGSKPEVGTCNHFPVGRVHQREHCAAAEHTSWYGRLGAPPPPSGEAVLETFQPLTVRLFLLTCWAFGVRCNSELGFKRIWSSVGTWTERKAAIPRATTRNLGC